VKIPGQVKLSDQISGYTSQKSAKTN